MSNQYHQPFLPDVAYHVFTRAIGTEKLFRIPENYRFFSQRMQQYVLGIAEIYAYTFLPNHIHLFVRIRSKDSLIALFEGLQRREFDPQKDDLSDFVGRRFGHWLNAYAKAYNRVYQRRGSLFMNYLRRTPVESNEDISRILFYIHKNAVHHGYTMKIGDWGYDSFAAYLNDENSFLSRSEILDFFGNRETFLQFHQQRVDKKGGMKQ